MPTLTILTDEWAVWVTGQLDGATGGSLSDSDIARIIGITDSQTRQAIMQLAASGDSATLTAAKTYADSAANAGHDGLIAAINTARIQAIETSNAHADAGIAAALAEAKSYTDAHAGAGGVSQTYVDNAVSTALTSARSFASAGDTATLDAANLYAQSAADGAANAANANTDAKLNGYATVAAVTDAVAAGVSSANAFATDADTAVLEAARAYTDSQGGGGGGSDTEYVDAAITELRGELQTYATTGDSDTEARINARTDDSIEAAADGILGAVDGKISAANDYADAGDIATLAAAKEYTDNNSGGGSGGVSQAYVDSGDTQAIAQAKTYADNADAANLSAAKSYADGKDATNLATAKTYADGRGSAAQSAAQAYTDTQLTPTGTVSVPVGSGVTAVTSTVTLRKVGNIVFAFGRITGAGGASVPAQNGALLIPSGYRPPAGMPLRFGVSTRNESVYGAVNANGTVDVAAPTTSSPYVTLDGCSWPTMP